MLLQTHNILIAIAMFSHSSRGQFQFIELLSGKYSLENVSA